MDFALLSSNKSQINGITEGIEKRTVGYKRRLESLLPVPQVIPAMIDRAISTGVTASYVLMDGWFTHVPLIQEILNHGHHVIGMVKDDKMRYLVNGNRLSLKELYEAAPRVAGKSAISYVLSIPSWCQASLS